MPGNRVLLRSANKPMLVACWFAVMKAGGIAVATMPMLRAKELKQIVEKGQVDFALCDQQLRGELETLLPVTPVLQRVVCFGDPTPDGLEALMARHDAPFANVDTAADDTCLLAFTSGTTGQPKATMHFHRDVMASCVCFPEHVLRADRERRLHRQPAARLHLRPRRADAVPDARRRLDRAAREGRARTSCSRRSSRTARPCSSPRRPRTGRWRRRRRSAASACATAARCASASPPARCCRRPTRALWQRGDRHRADRRHRRDRDAAHLHLRRRGRRPAPAPPARRSPATAPGWSTTTASELPPGTVGKLAVQGPTGCRYLDDERQANYVQGRLELSPATPT